MASEPGQGFLALADRAYAFVVARGVVSEAALLTYVYGGPPPPGLVAHLAAPLLEDPRLERRANGAWAAIGRPSPTQHARLAELELTTLALAASGPSPDRGRLVRLCAVHVQNGTTIERFEVTVNPGRRVPRYVTDRLGLAPELLDELPPFAAILDDLVRFLGARPVLAQDARLTWEFVSTAARREGRVLAEPLLVDANEIATRLLDLKGKPTLALVAAHLGIGTVRITRPEEEARVLGVLAAPLLGLAEQQGHTRLETLLVLRRNPDQAQDARIVLRPAQAERPTLRRSQTAQSQPDQPGVYVLRDVEQAALYVGKASRLRSRLAAYVHRPLGVTRRFEGLVGSVEDVDSTVCATDLEALVLEDREIRRLQPRYNTVRQQRTPRLWIRLPPVPPPRPGKRQPAPRRLEPSLGPGSADGEFVGPFRNQTIAEQARLLARAVFNLDTLRHGDPQHYAEQLGLAWHFLRVGGQSEAAEARARGRSTRLLHAVLAFDPTAQLLPADPREASYVVVRPGPSGIEGFLVDRGVFRAWSVLHDAADVSQFAADLLAAAELRTGPEDVDVVLRWFGAQRPPAILVHVPQDPLEAADAIEAAALALGDRLVQA
jgi:DNA polymerase III epsilon subunit-like protein